MYQIVARRRQEKKSSRVGVAVVWLAGLDTTISGHAQAWPVVAAGRRLDPAGGGEGVQAGRGGVGPEEDRMGTPGWRRTGWGGVEELAA
jgi:hypothetical protein